MRTRGYVYMAISIISAMAMGCNLDNDPVPCPPDHTGALAGNEEKMVGQWDLSSIVSDIDIDLTDDGTQNAKKDIFDQYNACEKDVSYTFKADRTYDFNNGQRASNCENKVKSSGTWKLSTDNTLGLVVLCNALNDKITFNGEETTFSFTNDITVRDVYGATHMAKITFTYTNAGSI